MTSIVTLQGIKIPPDELAKMPPEQRVGMEKMLADRVGKPSTSVEAKSPESVVGTIDSQRGDGVELHVSVAGKWLADSCEGTEPLMRKP